jgi:hypothetical protein
MGSELIYHAYHNAASIKTLKEGAQRASGLVKPQGKGGWFTWRTWKLHSCLSSLSCPIHLFDYS